MIKCKDDVEQQLLLDGDQQQLQQQRGLKTIVDKDCQKVEEKYYSTAVRLFLDLLSKKRYGVYPIQWMAICETDKNL